MKRVVIAAIMLTTLLAPTAFASQRVYDVRRIESSGSNFGAGDQIIVRGRGCVELARPRHVRAGDTNG